VKHVTRITRTTHLLEGDILRLASERALRYQTGLGKSRPSPVSHHEEAYVRAPRSVRALFVLGAILAAGCTDNATAPPAAKQAPTGVTATRKIDLSGRPDLRATITTVATVRSKDGRVSKRQFSQKVTAHFKDGLARAKKDALASADKSSSAFASLTEGSAMSLSSHRPMALTRLL